MITTIVVRIITRNMINNNLQFCIIVLVSIQRQGLESPISIIYAYYLWRGFQK